jgi:serine acetyltransferase
MRLRNVRPEMIASIFRMLALKIRLGNRIEVTFNTRIGPDCRVFVIKGGKLRLQGSCLTQSVTLEVGPNGVLEIGPSYVGPGSIIVAQKHVSIGDGSMLAEYVTIRDQNHLHSPEVPLYAMRFTVAPVHIGSDVWIAAKATVVAGVTIADHALCAAGAVVTKDVKEWERVGGVPARPLSKSDSSGAMYVKAVTTRAGRPESM